MSPEVLETLEAELGELHGQIAQAAACRAAVASILDRALPPRHHPIEERLASAVASEGSARGAAPVSSCDVAHSHPDAILAEILDIHRVLQQAAEAGQAASASLEAAIAAIATCRADLPRAATALDAPRRSSAALRVGGYHLNGAGFLAHRQAWSWSRLLCMTSSTVRAV
jgi:hypothetical protein